MVIDRHTLFLSAVVLSVLAVCAPAPASGQQPGDWRVLRVTIRSPEDIARLTAGPWDVLEARDGDDFFVLGDAAVAEALRAAGFGVADHETLLTPFAPLTYYGGYRTVEEHEAHLDTIVAAYPHLAVLHDFGDSWRKTRGFADGRDLKVLCITRLRPGDCALDPGSDKPRFFALAAVHARELSTAEIAWRWIDHLVNGYDVDPDVTFLLDTTEVWVVPIANPDGRVIVEQGGNAPLLQRKNANTSAGGCSIPYIGIDLNRNASWQWGVAGSSGDPCSQMYHGASPVSEPEEQAIEALMRALFRDQRGPALTDAAPITTSGLMVTLHSYGNLIILPWSWTTQPAANDAGLRAIAFRMGHYTGYTAGTGAQVLYPMSGNHDDWAYGVLGIPGFIIEIGSGSGTCGAFLPAYSCVDAVFWAPNRDALMYAARVARQPYALAAGPVVVTAALHITRALAGAPITLTATFDDGALGSGSGRPAAQAITAAEFFVDALPWEGGTPIALRALDGIYNTPRETAIAVFDAHLSPGRHTVYVRGRDALGNWGPLTALWLWVDPDTRGLLTGATTSIDGCDAASAPLAGVILTATGAGGASATAQSNLAGDYRLHLDEGVYTVTAFAPQHASATRLVTLTAGQTTTLDIALVRLQPCLSVTPSTLVTVVAPGESVQIVLSLTNGGMAPISVRQYIGAPDIKPIFGWTRSAPDASGYFYEAMAGLDWIDTSAGATLVLADDGEANVSLPFAVPFYGITTTALRVGDNGGALLGVTAGDVWVANRPLSDTTGVPNHFIAPFWDDLYPAGSLRWQIAGVAPNRKAVVAWHQRAHFHVQTDTLTFQVALAEGGGILFQYQDVDLGHIGYSFGASATVGIRGAAPAQSLTFSHNAPRVWEGMSICFRRPTQPPCWAGAVPWLDLSQPITLAGGETRFISLALSAPPSDTLPVYRATVLIDSAELPALVTLPVTMLTRPLPFQTYLPFTTHP